MAHRAIVVGAGGIAEAWFPALKAEKVDVAAVVDLRMDAAAARIDKYELTAEASGDESAMLAKHRPDFVVDLTVPEAHCRGDHVALRAGCHVIGEKPMASSMAEARRMVRAAEETGQAVHGQPVAPLGRQARRRPPHGGRRADRPADDDQLRLLHRRPFRRLPRRDAQPADPGHGHPPFRPGPLHDRPGPGGRLRQGVQPEGLVVQGRRGRQAASSR